MRFPIRHKEPFGCLGCAEGTMSFSALFDGIKRVSFAFSLGERLSLHISETGPTLDFLRSSRDNQYSELGYVELFVNFARSRVTHQSPCKILTLAIWRRIL